jgi:hypothetical protein
MKVLGQKLTAVDFLVLVILIGLGLSYWRFSAYEVIGPTKLYQARTNQVYTFASSEERWSFQWQAFWRGDVRKLAEKGDESTYVGESRSLSGTLVVKKDRTYTYQNRDRVIQIDDLRYQQISSPFYSVSMTFPLEAGKTYNLVLRQKIKKTSYKLVGGKQALSFTVLSSAAEEPFFEMLEVSE